MDERRPAASPEDSKSSGFLGGLRRDFLGKRSESDVLVDEKEDGASKGLRKGLLLSSKNGEGGATEEKGEGAGGRRTTEKASPPHKTSKVNNKCSADNPHFSPSGLESEGIHAPTCVDCRGAGCDEDCRMYLHSECLTKLLRRQNIDSVAELKMACVGKHEIHSAIIYMDRDMVEAGLWCDKTEPKKHFDEKNVARRARDDVETSQKKTSEVSTTSKTARDPSDNLNEDGKEKKPCLTHSPEPPSPKGAVQVKESEPTMYAMEKLLEPSPVVSVEKPSDAVFDGFLAKRTGSEVPVDSKEDRTSKGLRSGAAEKKKDEGGGGQHTTEKTSPPHESSKVISKCSADNPHFSPSGPGSEGIPVFTCGVLCVKECTMYLHGECLTKLLSRHNIGSIGPPGPHGAVQAKEAKRTMHTKDKLPEPSPATSVENPRKAGLKGKGKKQGHPKTPDGIVQVKESEPTMYTVEKLPEPSPAAPVENPREAGLKGKGKKQGHLKAPVEAIQVKELEPTMYTVENFPELPKALSECVQPDSTFKDDHEMVEAVVDGVKPFSRDLLLNTLHCAQPVERLRETIEMVMGRAYEPYRNLVDKIFNSEDLLRDFIGKLRIFIVSRERGRIIFSKSMYGRAMENQLQVTSAPPTISALSSPFCADGAGIERSDQLKDELTKPKNPSINPLGSLSGTYEKPFASSNRPVPRNPWKNVLDGAKTRSVTVEDRDCQVCLERFTSNGRVLSCPHKGCEEPYHEMVNFFLVTTN
ncbi:unnamed protein product [Nippostrongylus brasiliensis]|uniref:PHD-type domain-containing protein n=1 Tax=Nippostrongylus brasiliensis TaxID=27835 RepID=A0A158QY10_NIPBR|nr:unnamed protein product [Nippostrongylus brasiliensis]